MTQKVLLTTLVLTAGFSLAAQAQLLPPPKPGDEQPRADVTRQANGAGAPRTLPGGSRMSGPGTQTEDDEYVGRKAKDLGGAGVMKPLQPQGPLAAPSAKALPPRAASPAGAQPGATAKPLPGAAQPVAGGQPETEAWKRRK